MESFCRITQGVARGLALPWAVIFRAFGPFGRSLLTSADTDASPPLSSAELLRLPRAGSGAPCLATRPALLGLARDEEAAAQNDSLGIEEVDEISARDAGAFRGLVEDLFQKPAATADGFQQSKAHCA